MKTYQAYKPKYYPRTRTAISRILDPQPSILNFKSTSFTSSPHFFPQTFLGCHTPRYRYFFNGQEADNEVLGEGVSLGYEFRQYDARIERWWNIDPMADKCPGVAHNERLHNGYKKKVYLCGILT